MTFAYPWFFLLLIPLAVILWWAWCRPEPSLRVPSLTPYRNALGNSVRIPWRKLGPFFFCSLAAVLMVVALTRPRMGTEEIRQRAEGIDMILALDLSGSMQAIDVPKTIRTQAELNRQLQNGQLKDRLETAKEEIAKFIESRPNDRIGLIAFATQPYVVCPPTLDHAWLIANLERLEAGSIGDATGIAGPIASAVQRLKDSDAKSRIVVLFTDGANNVQTKVTPRQAAKLGDTFQITVYTVGIGSRNAIIKQEGLFGSSYVPYPGEFDEPLLKDIASITGGQYYLAADAQGMEQAMKEIDKLEKTSMEQPIFINWSEYYPSLCIAGFLLIVLAIFLKNTVFLKVP